MSIEAAGFITELVITDFSKLKGMGELVLLYASHRPTRQSSICVNVILDCFTGCAVSQ